MGGVLDVRSRKGAGSTFHFTMECGYVTPSQLEEVHTAHDTTRTTRPARHTAHGTTRAACS
jgi:hypothetical protein